MKTAIVIGAGFGGISSALRLKAKGYKVQLFERCSDIGGRAQTFEKENFIFDAGPTVITAPFLLEELFELFNKKLSDYIDLIELDPWYQFVFADGQTFAYGNTLEKTLNEIRRINPEDCKNYLAMLDESKKIYDIGFEKLAHKPFHNFSSMAKMIPNLIKLGSYKTVWSYVSSYLQSEYLRKVFTIQPLLIGGNPFSTTSIYSLIHFLEHKWGIHYAKGGTGALVKALKKLMNEEQIEIHLNSTVDKLLIQDGKVKGIKLEDGQVFNSDIVVSNADPAFLYKNLIDKKYLSISAKIKSQYAHFSMGLFVLYFGTKCQYKNVKHHTLIMGTEYKSLLTDIFNRKKLNKNISMYLHRPSASDESLAPAGCDSFYLLVPVPNLKADINWQIEGIKLRNHIVDTLSKSILPNLENQIIHDFFKTPVDYEKDYLSVHGAGFSIAPKLTQSAWFRFHNQAEGLENLYLVGAGAHPGAGIPGVLSSAKVIEELVP